MRQVIQESCVASVHCSSTRFGCICVKICLRSPGTLINISCGVYLRTAFSSLEHGICICTTFIPGRCLFEFVTGKGLLQQE